MLTGFRKNFYLAGLVLFMIIQAGCVPLLLGAAAGAGTVTYVKGEMKKTFNEPIYVLHQAALKSLRDMGIVIRDDEIELHYASIIGAFDDGKKYRVDIRPITEKSSEVKVRVGFFGDQFKSEMILNGLQRQLKKR